MIIGVIGVITLMKQWVKCYYGVLDKCNGEIDIKVARDSNLCR